MSGTWQLAVAAVFMISTCTFSWLFQVLWGLAAVGEKRDPIPAPRGQLPGGDPEDVPATVGVHETAPGLGWAEGDPAVPVPAKGG